MTAELYVTFDVEDFINNRSTEALLSILTVLKRQGVKGFFFITGHMAEKLKNFPKHIALLEAHEIGYHSTSHSVHPGIFEYTDIDDYDEAVKIALQREISHIDPLSGQVDGPGGIKLLRELFPNKKIEAFRAPGFSWSPPHIEALRSLKIKYDFSTNISKAPVFYKDIVFYPFPLSIDTTDLGLLLTSAIRRKAVVLDYHPNTIVNKEFWDSPFFSKSNPHALSEVVAKDERESNRLISNLEMHLHRIRRLIKIGLLEIGRLDTARPPLNIHRIDVGKVYEKIVQWPLTRFDYKPHFIFSHVLKFFDLSDASNGANSDAVSSPVFQSGGLSSLK